MFLSKILFYGILLPLSLLPFQILYFLSDIIFIFIYSIFGYRRKVVFNNIKNSFPEKAEKELRKIEKKFYRHLCDLIVESIKAFTISNESAFKRMKHRNPEILQPFYDQGKSLVMVGGHYGNWEIFAVTISQTIPHQAIALFTPLKNKFLNNKMLSSRGKFGLQLLPIQQIKKKFAEITKSPSVVIFGADQSPRKSQRAYWMKFLNQETGVQYGTEKFAKDYNLPVIFANIYKIKRGHYEVGYAVLSENPSSTVYGEITQMHTRSLEKVIQEEPAYWLWSHKRWKHTRPEGEVLNS